MTRSLVIKKTRRQSHDQMMETVWKWTWASESLEMDFELRLL